jgi:ubiquinone/menaquinone biosynthesis C-methylase UbiE
LTVNRLSDLIIGHYERHAAAWDADRANSAWNDKPWHDRFVAMLPKGASVLDLGCGSGSPVARHMVAQGLKITGVDSSPTFISLCRSRLPDHEWIVGDMRRLSLGRSFPGHFSLGQLFPPQPRRSARYV